MQFTQYKGNMRKTWQIVKTVINKHKAKRVVSNKFVLNDKTVTDEKKIADHFNNFFL
jgi:hypothetical protein